jgi:hypothetical protein
LYLGLSVLSVAIYFGLYALYGGQAVRWWILPVALVSYIGLYCAFALFCAAVLARDHYRIFRGDVVEADNEEPLSGASIYLENGKSPPKSMGWTSSDDHGRFLVTLPLDDFKDKPPEDKPVFLVGEHPGYCREKKSLADGNQEDYFKIRLRKCYPFTVSFLPCEGVSTKFHVHVKFFDHALTPAAFDDAGVDVDDVAQTIVREIPASRGTIKVTFTTRDLPQGYDIVSDREMTLPVTGQMVLGEIPCRKNPTPEPSSTPPQPISTATEPPNPCESMGPAAANQKIQAAKSRIAALEATTPHQTLQVYRQTANEPCFYKADRREILKFLAQWFRRLETAAERKDAHVDKKTGLIFPSLPNPETAVGLLRDFENLYQALAKVDPTCGIPNQATDQAGLAAKERAVRHCLDEQLRSIPRPTPHRKTHGR